MHTLNFKRIAVFASGNGTNAENLIRFFLEGAKARVTIVFSDRAKAPVLEKARMLDVEAHSFNASESEEWERVIHALHEKSIDLIVLAGFLRKIPIALLEQYPGKIINIHPALLPKFGGKGMYGLNVHKAVIENKEKKSGITIHVVDEEYDKGPILFQATCPVTENESPETLAKKIHQLEYDHFPAIVEDLIYKLP
jgi:phosphoribosylglycinamide formyltransferase 1